MDALLDMLDRSISLTPRTMSRISKGEMETIRADEAISESPLLPALRHQLLRLEALASVKVDGSKASYTDLVKLETSLLNAPLFAHDVETMYRHAVKLRLTDPCGTVRAICYMNAVEWISEHVSPARSIEFNIIDELYARYDENEIARVHNECSGAGGCDKGIEKRVHFDVAFAGKEDEWAAYLEFANQDIFSPSAQAEVSHALLQMIGLEQCKTDGYERALTHAILYRRGMLTKSISPLAIGPVIDIQRHAGSIFENMSPFLADGLSSEALRFDFDDTAFCLLASARTMSLCARTLEGIDSDWTRKLGLKGGKDTTGLLLRLFIEYGYLTIDTASKKMSRSFSMTSAAMHRLEEAGLIKEAGHASKRRIFCAVGIMRLFEALMKRLTSNATTTRDAVLEELGKSPEVTPTDVELEADNQEWGISF